MRIYIREDIPNKRLDKPCLLLFHIYLFNMLFVELNFRKCKWLLFGTYRLPFQADIYCFDNLDKVFDSYSSYQKRSRKHLSLA